MRTELELNEMILQITTDIRDKHPKLLQFLNDNTVTIPYQEHPTITLEILTAQYDSLQNIVRNYKLNGIENIQWENALNMPFIDVTVMEHKNAYQNLLTKINSLSVSYHDVGEGTIPIIFLHGFPFDKSMWKSQLDDLKSKFRLIAIDFRGFGQSTDEKTVLSMDLLGLDLIAFMDKLNIPKAIVCGLSMGGYVALNVVQKFPERFKALILCDTQCNADTPEGRAKRYATIEEINSAGPAAFNESFIKGVFHPNSFIDKNEVVEDLRNVVIGNTKEVITSGLEALATRSETCSGLKNIRIPTLIICGDEDQITPVAKSKAMQEQIQGAELKIIEQAGHVSNLEQPKQFNMHVSNFLNRLINSF